MVTLHGGTDVGIFTFYVIAAVMFFVLLRIVGNAEDRKKKDS